MKTVNELVNVLSEKFQFVSRLERVNCQGNAYAEAYKFNHLVTVCGCPFLLSITVGRFYRDGSIYFDVADRFSGYPFSDFNMNDYADYVSYVTGKSAAACKRMAPALKREIEAVDRYLFDLFKSFDHVLEAA